MIWHVSIKLRTSKGFIGFFKRVVAGVFVFQLFMWHFLVFSHGVFVSVSNGDNSTKTLLLIVCNFRAVERGCREGTKKLDNRNQVKIKKISMIFHGFYCTLKIPEEKALFFRVV